MLIVQLKIYGRFIKSNVKFVLKVVFFLLTEPI